MNQYHINIIKNVAEELQQTGSTSASTGEQIAAAFVLNNMQYLPTHYQDVIEAWDYLGQWQSYVRHIKQTW